MKTYSNASNARRAAKAANLVGFTIAKEGTGFAIVEAPAPARKAKAAKAPAPTRETKIAQLTGLVTRGATIKVRNSRGTAIPAKKAGA